jgi:hypothetical protein
MRPAREVLRAELLAVLPKRRPGQRGVAEDANEETDHVAAGPTRHRSLPRPGRRLAIADQQRSEETDGLEMTGVHLATGAYSPIELDWCGFIDARYAPIAAKACIAAK